MSNIPTVSGKSQAYSASEIVSVSEAQYAQGDVVRAVQTIVANRIPLTSIGALQCEAQMRMLGEGNRSLWGHPTYLLSVVHMAQEIVRMVLKGVVAPWNGTP